jgi:hypothetical protein
LIGEAPHAGLDFVNTFNGLGRVVPGLDELIEKATQLLRIALVERGAGAAPVVDRGPGNGPSNPIPPGAGGGCGKPELGQAPAGGEGDAIGAMGLWTVAPPDALHKIVLVEDNMLGIVVHVLIGQAKARDGGAAPRQSIAQGGEIEKRQLIGLDEQVQIRGALERCGLASAHRLNTARGPECVVQLPG